MKWINVGELTFNLFLIICVVKYQPIRKSLIRGVGKLLVENEVSRYSRETRPIERVLGLTGGTLQGQKK